MGNEKVLFPGMHEELSRSGEQDWMKSRFTLQVPLMKSVFPFDRLPAALRSHERLSMTG